ncbi:MAG: NAD(P)-binding domain-containing protein, partial [Actinomycetota bacterium]
MATIRYDTDASLDPLAGARIAVLGYGAQGRAHALNLRDSGLDVTVGLRKDSASWARAEEEGASVANLNEACAGAEVIAMLVP